MLNCTENKRTRGRRTNNKTSSFERSLMAMTVFPILGSLFYCMYFILTRIISSLIVQKNDCSSSICGDMLLLCSINLSFTFFFNQLYQYFCGFQSYASIFPTMMHFHCAAGAVQSSKMFTFNRNHSVKA